MEFLEAPDEILNVGEFSRRLKNLFKLSLPEMWIRGEISNLKTYSSGHIYFTLKDEQGCLSAVLFKGFARSMSLKLAEGMKILAFGEVSVYEQRGSYQLIVKAALPDGEGGLFQKFQLLKEKLEKEGLFDSSRKKEIPRLPQKIAVITSPTGAAIRDFISIITRRGFKGSVDIFPSLVQGALAPKQIMEKIDQAESIGGYDLLILMRGGGSLEDLWAFNDEALARRVFACKYPTISAVGHEVDFSLTDFTADLRAETPSAAAEYLTNAYADVLADFKNMSAMLEKSASYALENLQNKISAFESRLKLNSPQVKLDNFKIMLDEKSAKADALAAKRIARLKGILHESELAFSRQNPKPKIDVCKERLAAAEKAMALMSFESSLKRGWALAFNESGALIGRARQVKDGENISLRFYDGSVNAVAKK